MSASEIIDLQIDAESLWCLYYESKHYNKPALNAAVPSTSLTFKSSIERYKVRESIESENKYEKFLKNQVWTLDDQTRLENVEDADNIPLASVTNKEIKGRIYDKFGGQYVKSLPIAKNSNLINFIEEIKDERCDVISARDNYYDNEVKKLRPISLSLIKARGQESNMPLIVRQSCFSVLKENTRFTALGNFINKTVIDLQESYAKNKNK